MPQLTMFIVSDSVGETGELVAKAAISQFRLDLDTVSMKRFSNVEEPIQLKEIAFLAKRQRAFVVYTLVKGEMRELMKTCLGGMLEQ